MQSCPLCHAANADGQARCSACGGELLAAPPLAASGTVAHAMAPGTMLQGGAFSVDKVLGQGGFGITYSGRDYGLDRDVAIKEFFPFGGAIRILSDNRLEPSGGMTRTQFEDARQIFMEESRTLARFRHPGIVNVFASFEEKNTAYMVMEYLRGVTLQHLIDTRRTVPENEAVVIVEKVGSALEIIHGSNMLHRDLKPENILLCGGFDARVVLIDFGSARAFSAGSTTRLDVLVTPGYAPLEQYSDAAHFNAYTDIYALGATLYHALTGQAPAAAIDRTAGVDVMAPHQINTSVSRHVSEAVMWALQVKAADRPQTVREWLLALRSTKNSSQPAPAFPGSTVPTASPVKRAGRDPRGTFFKKILEQLDDATPAHPPGKHEARIREIRARLDTLTGYAAPPPTQCPSCSSANFEHIAPAIGIARCPLCEGTLNHYNVDPNLCPVCRSGALKEFTFSDRELFCPLCHVAPLKTEERKKLLLVDVWRSCPNCKAEWDEFSNNTAKLMTPGSTPAGAAHLGETHSLAQWKALSGRSSHVLRCRACTAQFDDQGEGRWTLVRHPKDPLGIAARYAGKTFYRAAWARLAAGLELGAGNCSCNNCNSEWNFDAQQHTLKLLRTKPQYENWRNQAMPVVAWRFQVKGKTSQHAGYLCRDCGLEFDDSTGQHRLVRSGDNLAVHLGRQHTLPDWQRLGRGLPDSTEEAALRHELKHEEAAHAQEEVKWREGQSHQRTNIEHELQTLAKQSFLEGYLPPRDTSIYAGYNEDVRWLSKAAMLRQKSRQGAAIWEVELSGTLMISATRIAFNEKPGVETWMRPLNKIREVHAPYVGGNPILELHFTDLKKPVGFMAGTMNVEVEIEGRTFKLTPSVLDLAEWLKGIQH